MFLCPQTNLLTSTAFMSIGSYTKLLNKNITRNYKKSWDMMPNIRSTAKVKLELDDRMETYAERGAFITLKNHKDNFRSKLTCRLIKPAKNRNWDCEEADSGKDQQTCARDHTSPTMGKHSGRYRLV